MYQYWDWCVRFMPKNTNLHMVGLAAICWAMWKSRNSISFEKKRFRSPTEIICLASSFLKYWAGLKKKRRRSPWRKGAKLWRMRRCYITGKSKTKTRGSQGQGLFYCSRWRTKNTGEEN
jgi:hypothetical protein